MKQGDERRSDDCVRVVVVEDDPGLRALYQALVAYDSDVQVTACSTIEEARSVDWSIQDIAIVDLGLPDGSGADITSWLAREHPDIRRVIATGLPLSSLNQGELLGAEIAVTKGDAWQSVVRGLILDLSGRRDPKSQPDREQEKESWLSKMFR